MPVFAFLNISVTIKIDFDFPTVGSVIESYLETQKCIRNKTSKISFQKTNPKCFDIACINTCWSGKLWESCQHKLCVDIIWEHIVYCIKSSIFRSQTSSLIFRRTTIIYVFPRVWSYQLEYVIKQYCPMETLFQQPLGSRAGGQDMLNCFSLAL